MKKLLILAGFILASNCFAAELSNYTEVKNAIVNGSTVRIALDFSKCTGAPENRSSHSFILGVYTPNEIVVSQDGVIKTAMKHFTLNDPTVPGKAVYQYVVYTIKADESVRIAEYLLDAVNYASLNSGSIFNCKISDGVKFYTQ